MDEAHAVWKSSARKGDETEVAKRKAIFETKKKAEFHNAYRAEYKTLIRITEQRG